MSRESDRKCLNHALVHESAQSFDRCEGSGSRDFKIWYGKAVVLRQIVKITSGDVMSRVPLPLSRRSLAFYYGKVPSFTYSSLREYKPAIYFSF